LPVHIVIKSRRTAAQQKLRIVIQGGPIIVH